jgi:hypothetical protein
VNGTSGSGGSGEFGAVGDDTGLSDEVTPDAVNSPPPALVVRPISGTPRFRRNCWVGVKNGALVASDRRNRRYEFPLNGTEAAPRTHFMFIEFAGVGEDHFVDGYGQSLVVIAEPAHWEGLMAIAEAAGLEFENGEVSPPLRPGGVRLEDSSWAAMRYVRLALAAGTILVTLGRLEIIGLFPWIFVAVGLMGYIAAALFSGVYFGPLPTGIKGRRAWSRPGARNKRKRRKRRLRRRG